MSPELLAFLHGFASLTLVAAIAVLFTAFLGALGTAILRLIDHFYPGNKPS